jgi:hypothetical protein
MDAMTLCLMLALTPLVPPHPNVSGWHMLAGPVTYHENLRRVPPERWYWDAVLRIWRAHPDAFLAETPEQMACDQYQYAAAVGEQTASLQRTSQPSTDPRTPRDADRRVNTRGAIETGPPLTALNRVYFETRSPAASGSRLRQRGVVTGRNYGFRSGRGLGADDA